MTLLQAIILGAVGGLTEYLPVSGSGHLVLLQHWFGLQSDMLIFDMSVHWGTLLAVFVFFWREILWLITQPILFLIQRPSGNQRDEFFSKHPYALIAGLIFISSIVTALVGLFCQEIFEYLFESVFAVGLAWIGMAILLIWSKDYKNPELERALPEMNHQDAFFIGLAQGLALIPGVSRFGSTVLMGVRCGLTRRDAARYAFLLGFPAILGVGFFKIPEVMAVWKMHPQINLAGLWAAAVTGFFSISWILRTIERGKYHYFGYYCLLIGLFAIASQFLKP